MLIDLKNCVLVLGCGNSISDLSLEEVELLNTCDVKIGINKYSAFYKISGITPTHVYFQDDYNISAILFLKHIFKVLREDGIKHITFVVSHRYKSYLKTSKTSLFLTILFFECALILNKALLKSGRFFLNPISKKLFNRFKKYIEFKEVKKDLDRYGLLPKKSTVNYIDIQDWNTRNNHWAKTLKQKLFHYRGSFTTILNYISIEYPNKYILLAGVDFNSPGYFFDKELSELNFDTTDWTTEISLKNKKHFSIIDYEGTKMDDEFPFIFGELEKTNNKIFSLSKNSYLVEKGLVKHIKL